jgi:hypothetical protein
MENKKPDQKIKSMDEYFEFLKQFWQMFPYPKKPRPKKPYTNVKL